MALKDKSAKTVAKSFDDIFHEAKIVPSSIETDQGTEFTGNQQFFDDKKIYFRTLRGKHKGNKKPQFIQVSILSVGFMFCWLHYFAVCETNIMNKMFTH